MQDPNAPQQLSRRTVGRAVDSIRHTENHDRRKYNGGAPPSWRTPVGDRHLWPIQVSGSEVTPNLWPAVLRQWTEYDDPDHVFETFGTEDIWAFPVPGGAELTADGEYLGAFVGYHTDGLGVFEVIPAGGGTLTTGNVGDAGAEDSSTTVLRFDKATGIRIDAGATEADPDVVKLVYTVSVDAVTNVCASLVLTKTNATTTLGGQTVLHDVSAALTLTVERQTLLLPAGTGVEFPVCTDNPTDCSCSVEFDCCAEEGPVRIPATFFVNIVNKTGVATCLPNSLEFTGEADGSHTVNSAGECNASPTTGMFASVSVDWTCFTSGEYLGSYGIYVSWSRGAGSTWASGGTIAVTPAAGWVTFSPESATKIVPCGDTGFADGEPVGTWTLTDGLGNTATFDIVLSL